ncbi:MAG: prephenate dehydrogenase/arogenate dehydrogenase family protein [Gammaproteobacteria bacterium]|nr:prephenate dehydrogenase/arogenate dehydrogenase family protein [Gammaproteobacteria bacterium]
MSLEDLRQRLSAIDSALIELIAQRQEIVSEVSAHKISTGAPTRDYGREREILERVREQAAALGAEPDVAEQIMRLLIRSSLTKQEQRRVAAESSGEGQRALIIGGAGKMGIWIAEFLASQGYGVELADPKPSEAPFPRIEDWQTSALDHDIIVIAAPLKATAGILEALAERKPPGLIFDVGSLKTPLKPGLEKLRESGCRVASLHPMFGPDTQLLSGRHIIFVDVGDPESAAEARTLFDSTMAELVDMTLEEHDRLIGYVLGLSHALNLAFFTALAGSGELVPKLKQLSSTTFDAQLSVASRVAGDNPHLYFEIQALNEYGRASLDALVEAAQHIRDLIGSNDEAGFVSLMEAGRSYLQADAAPSRQES